MYSHNNAVKKEEKRKIRLVVRNKRTEFSKDEELKKRYDTIRDQT